MTGTTPISSLPVTTTKQDVDLSAVRAGQIFSMANAREMVDRDPYGEFLAYGIPEKALGLGFEVMDSDKEDAKVIEGWKEKWKIINPEWQKIVGPGAGISRWAGRSIIVIANSTNPKTDGQPFVKVFEPESIEEVVYYNDGSLKGIKIKDRDPNKGTDVPLIIGEILDDNGVQVVARDKDGEPTVNDIDNVVDNINKSKKYFWEAQSYFEPIWDELVGLRLIRSGAVLFAVRVGAGLKIVKVPPNTDPDTLTEIKTAAKKLDSLNGWFVLPVDEAEVTIETGTGMVDYDALKQALLGSIAAKTGYPKAGFEGIEMERQGGSFNEERLLDCERIIQRKYKDLAKWLTIKMSDFHNWGITEENFEMRYVRREVVNEREQEEINAIIANKHKTYIDAGVYDEQWVRDKLGIEGTAPGKPDMFNIGVKGLNEPNKDKPDVPPTGDKE